MATATQRINVSRAFKLEDIPYAKGTILLGVRGSLAHGVYVPSEDPDSIDDKDFMGIVVPEFDDYFRLSANPDEGAMGVRGTRERMEGDIDLVEYEIKKFFGLALKANPNVLSLLWMKPYEYYPVLTDDGARILEIRDAFSSRRAIPAFTGYAHGQIDLLRRSTRHGFRGAKRRELIERHGYDTKNAAHAIRLLRMGMEFVGTGVLNVDRTGIDADELLMIKWGGLSLEEVEKLAADHLEKFKSISANTSLPELPNTEEAERVLRDTVKACWTWRDNEFGSWDVD